MKIMVTGSGGREHALAWRASLSKSVSKVFVAPGNAGSVLEENIENVAIDVLDFDAQIEFAQREGVALTIIGPEVPLAAGAVDAFTAAGLRCLGPSRRAAELEGSKSFCKAFMARHGIPTAAYQVFEDAPSAVAFAAEMTPPIVIKADGLAAGKGVILAASHAEAKVVIEDMLDNSAFGDAGARVVIEEFLPGEEASFIVIADGETFIPFASSQDHKPINEGDTGPNTGGMGAYSPAPVVTPEVHDRIVDQVIRPTIDGMAAEGRPFVGFLYAGLMINDAGDVSVVEFNCRFGDPETQPIMMRLQSDLVELCEAAIDTQLAGKSIEFDDRAALTVVMSAGGYPGDYEKGDVISGLAAQAGSAKVFHAGTSLQDGKVVTNGGRILGVTAMGASVSEARDAAYRCVDSIEWRDAYCRRDIGFHAIAREQSSGD
jgi:phosphoribosylamine--glycine ligase